MRNQEMQVFCNLLEEIGVGDAEVLTSDDYQLWRWMTPDIRKLLILRTAAVEPETRKQLFQLLRDVNDLCGEISFTIDLME